MSARLRGGAIRSRSRRSARLRHSSTLRATVPPIRAIIVCPPFSKGSPALPRNAAIDAQSSSQLERVSPVSVNCGIAEAGLCRNLRPAPTFQQLAKPRDLFLAQAAKHLLRRQSATRFSAGIASNTAVCSSSFGALGDAGRTFRLESPPAPPFAVPLPPRPGIPNLCVASQSPRQICGIAESAAACSTTNPRAPCASTGVLYAPGPEETRDLPTTRWVAPARP